MIEYTYDNQKAPQSLEDLAGYLRQVPVDPIVGNNRSWKLTALDGSPYGG